MKKAQGLSMNVIIIAALAIIVLIILVVVMAGRFNLFGSTARSCEAQAGTCKEACEAGEAKMFFTDCADKNPNTEDHTCCIPTYSIDNEQEEGGETGPTAVG